MELDQSFVSSLLHQNNLTLVRQYKIKPSVLDPSHRKVYKAIVKHFNEYGVMPKGETLEHYDPQFEKLPRKSLEPFDFYCNKLLERATFNVMRKAIEEGAEKLPTEVMKVVDNMRKALNKVTTDYNPSSDVEIASNVDDRKEAYEKAEDGLNLGIPFPWETLTEASMGMQPEDLISFVADSGVGKSWALIICAAHAYRLGYHVLFFTREMSNAQIQMRFDAVHGRFAYDKLRRGQLGTKGKDEYFDYLDRLSENTNKLYVSGDDNYEEKIGLDLVEAKIDEYKALLPDPEKLLVIVDGAYFLSADENSDDGMDWKVIAKVTQGLKRMARKKKVPMIISSQAKRGTKKKDTPDQSDVGFSYSIVQDSNILIILNQSEDMRAEKYMQFWVVKMRDNATVSWSCNWCFETMDFSEMGRGHKVDTGAYEGDDSEHSDSDYMEVVTERGGAGAYGSYKVTEKVLKPGRRKSRKDIVAKYYGDEEAED